MTSARRECDLCGRETVLREFRSIYGEVDLCPDCGGLGWDTVTIECVECPVCLFRFGAEHTDEDGGYTCPACEVEALEAVAP